MVLGPWVDEPGPDGDDCRLSPVGDAELREDMADVRLHRLLRQRQLAGDALVREAAGDEDQDLALARSQAVERPTAAVGPERLHQPRSHDRIEERLAGMRGAYRAHELLRLGVLEQVSRRTRPERRQQRLVVEKARQDDHTGIRNGLAQQPHRRHAVEPRHHQVHQDHVREEARCGLHGVLAVDRLAHDLDPLLQLEESSQPFPDDRMVVDDEHADRLSHAPTGA